MCRLTPPWWWGGSQYGQDEQEPPGGHHDRTGQSHHHQVHCHFELLWFCKFLKDRFFLFHPLKLPSTYEFIFLFLIDFLFFSFLQEEQNITTYFFPKENSKTIENGQTKTEKSSSLNKVNYSLNCFLTEIFRNILKYFEQYWL